MSNHHTPLLGTLTPYQAVAIVDNLEQQHQIYKQVEALLLQKKVSLLQQNVTELPEQDKALKSLRKQLDRLEGLRTQMVKEFWPHALEPVQAKMMILSMPQDQQKAFNQVRSDLKHTLNQVALLQEETQRLLQASLNWVNQSMAWVKHHIQSEKKELTYNAKGKAKASPQISTLHRQG
jgi:hypothetical protein